MRLKRKPIFYAGTVLLILLGMSAILMASNNVMIGHQDYLAYDNVDFDILSDYDYDVAKVDVFESVTSLLDLRPDGATFYANYDVNEDGTWGNGNLDGVAVGDVVVSNSILNMSGSTVAYVEYDADLNADMRQTGTIRFNYIPDYNGIPSATQYIFWICDTPASPNKNRISLQHNYINGRIYLYMYDYLSTCKVSMNLGVWSPTKDQSYEFELDFDIRSYGDGTRLFIDGGQFGSSNVNYFTRNSAINTFKVGTNCGGTPTSDFSISDILVFETVQHTSSYTIGETITDLPYYTDDPTIENDVGIEFDSPLQEFTVEETKPTGTDIKYIVSYNNGATWKYWDGYEWVTSDQSYTQASSASDIDANIEDLAYSGIFKFRAFLHSDDGMNTPTIENVKISDLELGNAIELMPIVLAFMVGFLSMFVVFMVVRSKYKIKWKGLDFADIQKRKTINMSASSKNAKRKDSDGKKVYK